MTSRTLRVAGHLGEEVRIGYLQSRARRSKDTFVAALGMRVGLAPDY